MVLVNEAVQEGETITWSAEIVDTGAAQKKLPASQREAAAFGGMNDRKDLTCCPAPWLRPRRG